MYQRVTCRFVAPPDSVEKPVLAVEARTDSYRSVKLNTTYKAEFVAISLSPKAVRKGESLRCWHYAQFKGTSTDFSD
jgi:hypothetical protein